MDFKKIDVNKVDTADELKRVLRQMLDGMEALSADLNTRLENLNSQNVKHLDFAATTVSNSRKLILANTALISELAASTAEEVMANAADNSSV